MQGVSYLDARVVDQHINRAKPRLSGLDSSTYAVGVGDIKRRYADRQTLPSQLADSGFKFIDIATI